MEKFKALFTRKKTKEVKDEMKKTVEQIVTEKGYIYEKHEVQTEDGYLLNIIHIPGLIQDDSCEFTLLDNDQIPKQPVMFQHGLVDSSDGWLANKEERCLPFILVNSGFDVWLSNSRGNK